MGPIVEGCGSRSLTALISQVLKDILNDVNVYFTEKGMRILTLDTARVALVDMFLAAENFEEYECPNSIVAGKSLGAKP